jgi:hypothetical protein
VRATGRLRAKVRNNARRLREFLRDVWDWHPVFTAEYRAEFPTPWREILRSGLRWTTHPLLLTLVQAYLWVGFLVQRSRLAAGPALVTNDAQAIAFGVVTIIAAVVLDMGKVRIVAALLWTWLLLIVDFSYFYWSHGTAQNFSEPLSHLDAIYFAVGTLTTAGTGGITATSSSARGLQLLEMVLGLALIAFALAVVINRFAVGVNASKDSVGDGGRTEWRLSRSSSSTSRASTKLKAWDGSGPPTTRGA